MLKSTQVNRFVFEQFKKDYTQKFNVLVANLCKKEKGKNVSKIKKCFYKIYYSLRVRRTISAFINLGLVVVDEYEDDKYYLTDLAKDILKPQLKGDQDFEKLLEWTYVVSDKQYFLYSWNDAKVSGLITVDAALMAGILFVLQLLDGSQGLNMPIVSLITYGISFVLLALSIIFCLLHTIPKLNSKMGTGNNLKTMIGINRYRLMQNMLGGKDYFRAEKYYLESVKCMSNDDLLEMNLFQIIGMNTNNINSHLIIRKGVIATVLSLILLIFATGMFVFLNI